MAHRPDQPRGRRPRGAGRPRPGRSLCALSMLTAAGAAVSACGGSTAGAQTSVGANVAITPALPPAAAWQEPYLAVDPRQPSHIAVAYNEGTHDLACYLAVSADGGSSWRRMTVTGAGGLRPLPAGVTHCQHPKVAYGRSGQIVYVFQDSGFRRAEPQSIHVLATTSTDGGTSFSMPQILDPDAVAPNDWYPHPAVDPNSGRIWVVWTRYVQNFNVFPGHTVASFSDDGGRTFGPALRITPPEQSESYVGSPVAAVGRDGTLYASYLPSVAGKFSFAPGDLQAAASSDGGATFTITSLGAIVDGCVVGQQACTALRPFGEVQSLAAGAVRGSAYIAWWDDRGPGKLARISFASTRDGGRTWSSPSIVGVPQGRAGDQQYHPSVAVAPGGRIDLAYYDLSPQNRQDVYWAFSTDGGATFSTPRRIDTVASNAAVGPASGPAGRANIGFYLGLDSTADAADIAWTDMRRGTSDNGHQDVDVATVTVGSAGG